MSDVLNMILGLAWNRRGYMSRYPPLGKPIKMQNSIIYNYESIPAFR